MISKEPTKFVVKISVVLNFANKLRDHRFRKSSAVKKSVNFILPFRYILFSFESPDVFLKNFIGTLTLIRQGDALRNHFLNLFTSQAFQI